MTDIEGLWSALAGAPHLPGAACIGESELFDEYEDPSAIELATRICMGCPALVECSDWYNSLPPIKRPLGVTAGQLKQAKRKEVA